LLLNTDIPASIAARAESIKIKIANPLDIATTPCGTILPH
jgi:hypothetical protein